MQRSEDKVMMSNSTSMAEYRYSAGFMYGTLVCLGLAAAVGLVGNMLLVIVITQARKLRSVMNRFILHLAIGDLIVCVICIPLFLAINFYPSKSSHTWICKIGRFLQYLAPQGSMMLLITIGMNRHQAIVHPLQGMTYRTANKLIVAAWLYSLLVVAPSLYLTQVQFYTNPDTNTTEPYCSTIPVNTKFGISYVLALAFLGYVIPLTTLLVLYSKISCAVWKRNSKNTELRASRPAAAMLRTRKKVIKMFLTVILVFVITWVPLIIYVGVLEPYFGGAKRISYVRLALYAIGLSNSIYNPFIYSFFNNRFRESCKSLFKRSVHVITRTTAEREKRQAVPRSGKSEPRIPGKEPERQTQPTKDWMDTYSPKAIREHNEENTYRQEKEDIKLIKLKFITEEQADPPVKLDNDGYHSRSPKKTTEQTAIKDEHCDTSSSASGSVDQFVKLDSRQHLFDTRKRPVLFKTLSEDHTRSREQHKKPKLRQTLSCAVESAQWSNDFDNIF